MTLAEIESLAREGITHWDEDSEPAKLVRAVLDVLPVVKAAEAWADAEDDDDGQENGRLMAAVMEMRGRGALDQQRRGK